jgi:hypothetical protein
MRPYSGRLRPRDVRAGSGAPSSAVPLLIPPAASHSAANRPSRNPGTSSAAAPGRTAHPRPPPPPPGEATLGQRLCERGLFPAQVLVLVHQLNQLLTRAPSLEKVCLFPPPFLSLSLSQRAGSTHAVPGSVPASPAGFRVRLQSVATTQAARGWVIPRCRHFKNQSCFCLGSAFEVASLQTRGATKPMVG